MFLLIFFLMLASFFPHNPEMNNARKEYIRLLSRNVAHFTPEPGVERDAMFNGELIDAGHVTGVVRRNPVGVISGAATTGMTVQGRLFLNQLQKEERDASLWAKLKMWGVPILTYVIGVITPVISDWLKVVFHLKP
jgi:hypothetical protein